MSYAVLSGYGPHNKTIPINPFINKLSICMNLAKAFDVPLYCGSACGPLFVEIPEDPREKEIMKELISEENLTWDND